MISITKFDYAVHYENGEQQLGNLNMSQNGDKPDQEMDALAACINSLAELDKEAKSRVVQYICARFGLSNAALPQESGQGSGGKGDGPPGVELQTPSPTPPGGPPIDIRTFKEEKKPSKAIEMAAVAAFYLSELAPAESRKQRITDAEFKEQCKLARFPVPTSDKTLPNAKAAGYFSNPERGQYELNPVGYNLVAHKLPKSSD